MGRERGGGGRRRASSSVAAGGARTIRRSGGSAAAAEARRSRGGGVGAGEPPGRSEDLARPRRAACSRSRRRGRRAGRRPPARVRGRRATASSRFGAKSHSAPQRRARLRGVAPRGGRRRRVLGRGEVAPFGVQRRAAGLQLRSGARGTAPPRPPARGSRAGPGRPGSTPGRGGGRSGPRRGGAAPRVRPRSSAQLGQPRPPTPRPPRPARPGPPRAPARARRGGRAARARPPSRPSSAPAQPRDLLARPRAPRPRARRARAPRSRRARRAPSRTSTVAAGQRQLEQVGQAGPRARVRAASPPLAATDVLRAPPAQLRGAAQARTRPRATSASSSSARRSARCAAIALLGRLLARRVDLLDRLPALGRAQRLELALRARRLLADRDEVLLGPA